jgi:hypothetical protein
MERVKLPLPLNEARAKARFRKKKKSTPVGSGVYSYGIMGWKYGRLYFTHLSIPKFPNYKAF